MNSLLRVTLVAAVFLIVGSAQDVYAQNTCPVECSSGYVSCSQPCEWGGDIITCGDYTAQCDCPHYAYTIIDQRRVDLGVQCPNPVHPERNKNAQQFWRIHEDACGLEPEYWTCYFEDEFCSDPGTYEGPWCPFCGYNQACPA